MASSDRFGYEWDTYSAMTDAYEGQFRNWVHPLSEGDFVGKSVLDVGCGMGRNSVWPLKWGAREVTAFDLDPRTVARAGETLKSFPNATIAQKSIYDIDWKDRFDIAMSIGVIHHLEDPKKALSLMTRALKPGGTLLIWVYSHEGNELYVKIFNPIRKAVTSKLPVSIVHALSYLLSIPLWMFVKIFRGPTGYFKQLSKFSLWHIHSIVFDQLIPTVANYWSKSDLEGLFGGIGLRTVSINRPPNGNGWTVIGTKQ